eukprot:TRINITY_DN2000_c0_g1_i2.p1 TRINITY_DN2000_c0_g1~~TRINITY_DN2000_c0_g1_i2.p1  ORF type:complete len:652 (+),score=130.17 TRINITY_DN2000_c0_g1_i2:649-2604(+)
MSAQVWLNVYSHSSAAKFGLPVYHTGVEVEGKEYSFDSHAGVVCAAPHRPPAQYTFNQAVEIGPKIGNVEIPVEALSSLFSAERYCVISHNCNHFSEALCSHLTGRRIPEWINQLATKASEVAALAGGSQVLAAVANATLSSSRAELEQFQLESWLQDEAVKTALAGIQPALQPWLHCMRTGMAGEAPALEVLWCQNSAQIAEMEEEEQLAGFVYLALSHTFRRCCRPQSQLVSHEVMSQIAHAFGTQVQGSAAGGDQDQFCHWVTLTVINGRAFSLEQLQTAFRHIAQLTHMPRPELELNRTKSELVTRTKLRICGALVGNVPTQAGASKWLAAAPQWIHTLYANLPVGQALLCCDDPLLLANLAATRIQRSVRKRLIQCRLQKWHRMSATSGFTNLGAQTDFGNQTLVQRWRTGAVGTDLSEWAQLSPVGTVRAGETGLLRIGLRCAIKQTQVLTQEVDTRGAATHAQLLVAINQLGEALQLRKEAVLERCEQVCAEYRREAESHQQSISMKAEVGTVLCEEARLLCEDVDPDESGLVRWHNVSSRDDVSTEHTSSSMGWDQHTLVESLESVGTIELSDEARPNNFGTVQSRWHLPVDRCQAALCLLSLTRQQLQPQSDQHQHQVDTFFSGNSMLPNSSEFMKAERSEH